MVELRSIQKLKHKNIILVKEIFHSNSDDSVIYITEVCEYGDLQTQMNQRVNYYKSAKEQVKPYPEEIIRSCLAQIT